jgi:hypothetical protein
MPISPRRLPTHPEPRSGVTDTKTYTAEARFVLLVEQGGGPRLGHYLSLPKDTKTKLLRLFRLIKMLPSRALTADVQDTIVKELEVTDFQRLLYMLSQGGYLTREKDFGHRIVHVKTELAKSLNDAELAADLVAKNSVMVGFPVSTRPRGKGKRGMRVEVQLDKEQAALVKATEDPVVQLMEMAQDVPEVVAEKPKPVNELREVLGPKLGAEVVGLNGDDIAMVSELVKSLKAIRSVFPKYHREQFMETFTREGRGTSGGNGTSGGSGLTMPHNLLGLFIGNMAVSNSMTHPRRGGGEVNEGHGGEKMIRGMRRLIGVCVLVATCGLLCGFGGNGAERDPDGAVKPNRSFVACKYKHEIQDAYGASVRGDREGASKILSNAFKDGDCREVEAGERYYVNRRDGVFQEIRLRGDGQSYWRAEE